MMYKYHVPFCFVFSLDVVPTPNTCFNIVCSEDEECQMKGPYPTCVKSFGICWAMGDPHYYTFDRSHFDFMGTCTYVVTRNNQENDSLPVFEVLAKNENRGDISVSYVSHVIVNTHDTTITIESCQPGKVKVDPFYLFIFLKVTFRGHEV